MTASAVVRQSVAVADPDNPSNCLVPNADGTLPIANGASSHMNLTASAVIKAAPGRSYTVTVSVAGSGAGSLNDCLTVGAAAAANQVGSIPATVGSYQFFGWPHAVGIVLVVGTGQTLAISYT